MAAQRIMESIPTMLPMTWAEIAWVPCNMTFKGGTAITMERDSIKKVHNVADRMNPSMTGWEVDPVRSLSSLPKSKKTLAKISSSSMLTMKLTQWIQTD